ncbi:S8 family serine peptidase, partial [Candidatus Micrarchaeota archaeon]|nr:S8 family serine peptidase [Candidatus Micrarchaeota archaeon]
MDSEVKSIYSDRKVFALLDFSVPQISAPVLWSLGFKGENIKVAVLDTGIDKTHSMLEGKVILEENFSSSPTVTDNFGHGTHVAGIIAGTNETGGLYNGVAPQTLLYNAKVLNDSGTGTMSGIIEGINWAVDPDGNPETDDGTDIINLSLGAPTTYNSLDPIHSAINEAINKRVIVVVSSGNCGEVQPSPNCYGYIGVTTPGNNPNALTVGAIDDFNNWGLFSSGENIAEVGIKPDVVAPGVSINSSTPYNNYGEGTGTSMAAPHATGAAALLLNANSLLTPIQIKKLLELNAFDLGTTGKDTNFGFGLINLGNIIEPKPVFSEENIFDSIDESQVFLKNIEITNYGVQELLIYEINATQGIEFSVDSFFLLAAETTNLNFSINGAEVGVGTYNGQIDINTNVGTKTVFVTLQVVSASNPVIRSFNIPKTVFRGEIRNIEVTATDDLSVNSVSLVITDPFNVSTELPLTLSADGKWRYLQYQFSSEPLHAGRYDVNVIAVDNSSNTTVVESYFDLVNVLSFFPEEFIVNKVNQLNFTYKNTTSTSKEATIITEVYNETGFLINSLSKTKDIGSNQIVDLNLSWNPTNIGKYSLNLKFFEENILIEETDKNVTVLLPDVLEITDFSLESNTIIKGNNQTYNVLIENSSEEDFNAVIEINVLLNDLIAEVITIENAVVPANSTQLFSTSKQVLFPAGNYTVKTKLHYGNRIEEGISGSFQVITPANGLIELVILPTDVFIDQNYLIQVNFINTGNFSLNVVMEAKIIDENQIIDSIDFGSAQVPALNSFVFESFFEFKNLSGEYLLKATANYEGNIAEKDENLFVIDNKNPLIADLSYESEVKKNNPFIVKVNVIEEGNISSAVLNVNSTQNNLMELFSFGSFHWLIGVFYDTSAIQENDFTIEICDAFNNCSSTQTQSFNVVDCTGENLLIVSEEDYFTALLEPNYCVSKWKKSENGIPSIEFLQRFSAVIWSEANNLININEDEAILLENYVVSGGKILLEGSEIAFKHKDNNFMFTVARSKLAEDLIFSASDSNSSSPDA